MSYENDPEIIVGKRKNYIAKFDRYITDQPPKVFIRLVNVIDEQGELIKPYLYLDARKAPDLIGEMLPGQAISSSAQIEVHKHRPNGYKLINIIICSGQEDPNL